jgi:phage FluMu protein Com
MVAVVRPLPAPVVVRLVEWRCPKCRRLLGRVALGPRSVIEVKCEKCGTLVERRTD